jgi:cytochrome P450
VYIHIYALNFDEEIWGADADMFTPDRWKTIPSTTSNYNLLTFLQGPRWCIGERFAELTMKVISIRLIQKPRVEEVEPGRRMTKKSMITTRPEGGVFLKVSAL